MRFWERKILHYRKNRGRVNQRKSWIKTENESEGQRYKDCDNMRQERIKV